MHTISRILVAYDFSDDSRRALKEAFHLADKFGAQIFVVHALPEEVSEAFVQALSSQYKTELSDRIKEELQIFHGQHKIRVADADVHVLQGEPAKVIVDEALASQVDLILVGAHNKSTLGRFLLGSVASRIVRYSTVPVFVCRTESKLNFTKILVPIDDSDVAEEAIVLAKPFAEHFNADIQLLHVVDEAYFSHAIEYKTVVDQVIQKSSKRLRELNVKYALKTDPLVIDERASHGIIETVRKDADIGLVVMTTHGRSGLSRFLLGSTAESVVQQLPCSVLTVHPASQKSLVGKIFREDYR